MWSLPGKLSIGWQLTTGTRRTTWWPLPDPTPDRTLFKVVILSTLGLVIPLPLFWPWTASSNIHRLSKNSYYAHTRNLSLRKNQSPKEPRHPALYHWKSLQSHSAKLLSFKKTQFGGTDPSSLLTGENADNMTGFDNGILITYGISPLLNWWDTIKWTTKSTHPLHKRYCNWGLVDRWFWNHVRISCGL